MTTDETDLKIMLRGGNSTAALMLGMCYVSGSEGYKKDLDLGLKYLKVAAELCHPEALHIMTQLLDGGKYGDLKIKENLSEHIRYLRMLCGATRVVDFNSLNNGKDTQKFERYAWQAYATLGRLYVLLDTLNNLSLGLAMSHRGADVGHMTESYFALGMYYGSIEQYETSCMYLEAAANNDNSYWANEARKLYNKVVLD